MPKNKTFSNFMLWAEKELEPFSRLFQKLSAEQRQKVLEQFYDDWQESGMAVEESIMQEGVKPRRNDVLRFEELASRQKKETFNPDVPDVFYDNKLGFLPPAEQLRTGDKPVFEPASSGINLNGFQFLMLLTSFISAAGLAHDPKTATSPHAAPDSAETFSAIRDKFYEATKAGTQSLEQFAKSGIEYISSQASAKKTFLGTAADSVITAATISGVRRQTPKISDVIISGITSALTQAGAVEAVKDVPVSKEEFALFWYDCGLGRIDKVKNTLKSAAKSGKLKALLTMRDDLNDATAMFIAANAGHHKVVSALSEAAEANSQHPELSRQILIEVINGHTPFSSASDQGRHEVVVEILKLIKNKPELIKEILQIGKPFYRASSQGRHEDTVAMIKVAENSVILDDLIKYKLADKQYLSVMNYLIMSGNWPAIQLLLKHNHKLGVEKLPDTYHTDIPQTSIYYLETFLGKDSPFKSSSAEGYKASYFQMQGDKLEKVSFDEVSLSSKPILVELSDDSGQKKKRKTILGGDIHIDSPSQLKDGTSYLKKMIEFADKQNVKKIVMNFDISAIDGLGHAITLTFKRSDKNWSVAPHESNGGNMYDAQIRELVEPLGIKIIKADLRQKDSNDKPIPDSIKDKGIIIPNYSSTSTIAGGNCDIISSLVGAASIIGIDYTQEMRAYCAREGRDCVEKLGRKLNRQVDKLLQSRFEKAKERFAKEEGLEDKKERSVPSASVQPSGAQKAQIKDDSKEL